MRRWITMCCPPLAAACLVLLVLAGSHSAQDKKHGNKELYNSLRDVINTGADMFNLQGDHAGCYRVYHGALLAVKPFVTPDLQKEINTGIANAERMPRMTDRAFELRRVIDLVRASVREGGPPIVDKDKKTDGKKDGVKKFIGKTLWERLGGEDNVAKVVDDFVITAGSDPKVNVTRDGKVKINVDELKIQLIAFISHHTGGPYKYTGKNMKEAHKGMGITEAEFDTAGLHLIAALQKHKVAPEDGNALMGALGGMRKDIVEGPAKGGVKKDGAKKDAPPKDGAKKDGAKKDAPAKDGGGTKDAPAKDGAKKDGANKDAPPKDGTKKAAPEKRAKVAGKVTLAGKALSPAYVTFVADDNRKFTTLTVQDGTYGFRTLIPQGAYRIYVEPAGGEGVRPAIPDRYRSEKTSGLKVQIEGPNTAFDISLSN